MYTSKSKYPIPNAITVTQEPPENFVITICTSIDPVPFDRLKSILDSFGAISTGNQFGGNVEEYFFAVNPEFLNMLKQTLLQQIPNNNITYEIY